MTSILLNTLPINASRMHKRRDAAIADYLMSLVPLENFQTAHTSLPHLFPVGDGRLGYPDEAPYDAIHVGAAAPTVPEAVSLSPHSKSGVDE